MYESWRLPWAVLLGSPLVALGAFFGVWLMGFDNNVYVQIGLVMLIGLAAKNAILIVEFAKAKHEEGASLEEAALTSARLRFRPILMTAFAFILGVVPLMIASGAGAGRAERDGHGRVLGHAGRHGPGRVHHSRQLHVRRRPGPAPSGGGTGTRIRPRARHGHRSGARRRRIELMRQTLCGLMIALALTGCTVGPDYQRPPLNIPSTYRGPTPAAASSSGPSPIWNGGSSSRTSSFRR